MEGLGRTELHCSLLCFEEVLTAVHYHLFPCATTIAVERVGADSGAANARRDEQGVTGDTGQVEQPPRQHSREEVACLLAATGDAAQAAFNASAGTSIGKLLAAKLAIAAVYAANRQAAAAAKSLAFRFLARMCQLPATSLAVSHVCAADSAACGPGRDVATVSLAVQTAAARDLLRALFDVGQALAALQPTALNEAMPRVPAEGGLLHPCWELPTGRWDHPPVTLRAPCGTPQQRVVALTCALGCVAAGTEDGFLRVWSMTQPGSPLIADAEAATGVILTLEAGALAEADEEAGVAASVQLFSGSADHTIVVWRLAPDESQRAARLTHRGLLEGHRGWVRCLAYNPASHLLYSGSGDFTVRCWSLDERPAHAPATAPLHTVKAHKHWVLALALWENYLFAGSADRSVSMMELGPDGKPSLCHVLAGAHSNHIRSLAVWASTLFTSSADGTISMWCIPPAGDPNPPACVGVLAGHTGRVVDLHVTSARLLSASSGGEIKIWALDGGPGAVRCVQTLHDCWRHADDGLHAVRSDGVRLFFSQGTVKVW